MNDHDPLPTPTTSEGQNILLAVLGREVRSLTGDVRALTNAVNSLASTMATKVEMEAMRADLHRRIDALATEFKARDAKMSETIDQRSLGSSLDRFLSVGTRVMTFALVLVTFGGVVGMFVMKFNGLMALLGKP